MVMIKPLRDLVLVQIEDTAKKAGLVIPDSAIMTPANLSTTGVAFSVGPDCKSVKEKDIVHYLNYVGNAIKDDSLPRNYSYIIVSEKDILCTQSR